jgi:hypothetical protein
MVYRNALNVAISFVRKEVQRRKISVPLAESLHDTSVASPDDLESGKPSKQVM